MRERESERGVEKETCAHARVGADHFHFHFFREFVFVLPVFVSVTRLCVCVFQCERARACVRVRGVALLKKQKRVCVCFPSIKARRPRSLYLSPLSLSSRRPPGRLVDINRQVCRRRGPVQVRLARQDD